MRTRLPVLLCKTKDDPYLITKNNILHYVICNFHKENNEWYGAPGPFINPIPVGVFACGFDQPLVLEGSAPTRYYANNQSLRRFVFVPYFTNNQPANENKLSC